VWRNPCSVQSIFKATIAAANLWVSQIGCRVEPSHLANTSESSGARAQAGRKATFMLAGTVCAQFRHQPGRDRDVAPAVLGLRRLEAQPGLGLFERAFIALSRSTPCQRNANASPRRAPVPSKKETMGCKVRPSR
jgi:hypothetical protein